MYNITDEKTGQVYFDDENVVVVNDKGVNESIEDSQDINRAVNANESTRYRNGGNQSSYLMLIPKYEDYMEYVIAMIIKIPKIAKFNIGNEVLNNMYSTLKNVYYLNKISKNKRLDICNELDASFNYQRTLVRIMYKEKYIDEKKFNVTLRYLRELSKMLGGYLKSLGVNI